LTNKPLPISLIVDDPAPCINPLWYFRNQVRGHAAPTCGDGSAMARDIPVDFLKRFAQAASESGIRGKFSVLPCPAGLGPVSGRLEGYPESDVLSWLEVVRAELVPLFDITPEILTHTMALDLDTLTLLDVSEHEWSQDKSRTTLAEYIALGLSILKDVGIDATGVTSPCDFGARVEQEYAGAVLDAQKRVCGRDTTWYFLNFEKGPTVHHTVMIDSDEGRCVGVTAATDDPFWQSMDTDRADEGFVSEMADLMLAEDGLSGRLAELHAHGSPITICTHWQSLYSNGRATGLSALALVAKRVQSVFGNTIEWTLCSEQASRA
jgi:hypothetical protein